MNAVVATAGDEVERLILDLLRQDPDTGLLRTCRSGQGAIDCLGRAHPDLVFLQVELPDLSGLEVLERVRAGGQRPLTVLLTSNPNAAVRAFELNLLDCLLTPLSRERVGMAIQRAKRRLSSGGGAAPPAPGGEGRQAPRYASPSGAPAPSGRTNGTTSPRLEVSREGEKIFVEIAEIEWVEAVDYYMRLHLSDGRSVLIRRTMSDLSRRLEPFGFCRIHRSYLVRVDRVRALKRRSGKTLAALKDGRELPVSRTHRDSLEERLRGSF